MMPSTATRDETMGESPELDQHPFFDRHQWFEQGIEALLPRLMGTALRLTRNRSDAEDLVAEALATGWSKLDTLENRDALGSWLCRILTNTFISERRTAASRAETEVFAESESGAAESFSLFERLHQPFLLWQNNPEKEFLDRLLREDLEAAIDALPDVFRVAVILVDVQGFSYQEAAESLEIPVGTVRSRLARGRSQLQEALWTQAVDAGYRKQSRAAGSTKEAADHVPTEPSVRLDPDRGGADDE